MRILLIDADSTIPNLALMKLSGWHKDQGDSVSFLKINLPYYPNKKRNRFNAPIGFDKIYASIIFDGNKEFICGKNIEFGGTGVDLSTKLYHEIENHDADYSLYPENDISYGFITRGCIRKCGFCKVPEKEGYIHKVNNIDDIVRHKKVKFLDNNILAYPEHKKILQELVEKQIRCQFNQGLDIRLINEDNSILLKKINYMGEYIFAFDNLKYKKIIEDKLLLLHWRKEWSFKFFVYINPDMPISDTLKRISWLKENKCLPYIMRDVSCWASKYNKFYIDIAAYCNQVHLFKKMNFIDFLEKRHNNKKRIVDSLNIWNENI